MSLVLPSADPCLSKLATATLPISSDSSQIRTIFRRLCVEVDAAVGVGADGIAEVGADFGANVGADVDADVGDHGGVEGPSRLGASGVSRKRMGRRGCEKVRIRFMDS